MYATLAVAKMKPKKIQFCSGLTIWSHDLCDTGAAYHYTGVLACTAENSLAPSWFGTAEE